jgi:hypothetical protein
MKDHPDKINEAKEVYYYKNSISPLDERFNIISKRDSQNISSFLDCNDLGEDSNI